MVLADFASGPVHRRVARCGAFFVMRGHAAAAATSPRPGALSTNQWQSPACLNAPRGGPRVYDAFPRERTHPPAWWALCQRAHPRAPVLQFLDLLYLA